MLPTMSKAEFDRYSDAELVWACWEPTTQLIRGKSMQVKRQVYESLNPSRRALYMFYAVYGHAGHGVVHLLGTLAYVLEQPDGWRAIRGGFAFFGAGQMVELLPQLNELFSQVSERGPAAGEDPGVLDLARAIEEPLANALRDALHLVASYIRSHPLEFVQFVA